MCNWYKSLKTGGRGGGGGGGRQKRERLNGMIKLCRWNNMQRREYNMRRQP